MGGTHWDKYMGEYRKMMNATGWDGTVAELHRLAPADAFRPFGYTMSKRAMNGYAASKTVYFAKKGIRINVVMQGSTEAPSGGVWILPSRTTKMFSPEPSLT